MTQTLRQRLQACLADGSRADKALASYMLSQMASLPFETAASLAEKVSVSEPTVGRFCRTLGYRSLKDLKASLAEEIGDRPWLISVRRSCETSALPSPTCETTQRSSAYWA